MTARALVRIGCAGWSLPRAADPDATIFTGGGTHLERYARVFSCVEINSSFYRPHQPGTYARWRDSTPDSFLFSVKMPKRITHELRLRDAGAELDRFLEEAGMLEHKFGALLVQLPPGLALDLDGAERFFTLLRERLGARDAPIVVCEARHASWFGEAGSALLDRHGVSRVIADPPAVAGSLPRSTAAAVYVRLHGSPVIYRSAYPREYLRRAAQSLRRYAGEGRPAWVVFDNTADGAAVPDALALQGFLDAT